MCVCVSDGEAARRRWNTYSDCGCLSSVSPWPAHGLLHLCNNKKWLTSGMRPGHSFSVQSTLQEGRNPFNSVHLDYMVKPGQISHRKRASMKWKTSYLRTFTPESSRLMLRLAGQELLVMPMAGPFIPGPVYTSKWLLDRGSWKQKTLLCQLQTTAVQKSLRNNQKKGTRRVDQLFSSQLQSQ